jgi:hypothetical protein
MTQPMTIAEDVQLMLMQLPGRLEIDQVIPTTGSLVELALLGRLSSVEKKGFFVDPIGRLLTVADPTPIGQPILDAALAGIVKHGKPWQIHRAILSVRMAVLAELYASLEARGFVRAVGAAKDSGSYLDIVDTAAVDRRRTELGRARTLPHTVTDPRIGAVVDILRNSGNIYRGATGPQQPRTEEWYPAEVSETVDAILRAEHYLTLSL